MTGFNTTRVKSNVNFNKKSYAGWEDSIENSVLQDMCFEERDTAYDLSQKLYVLMEKEGDKSSKIYETLNMVHYFLFKKPISVMPELELNSFNSSLSQSFNLTGTVLRLDNYEPAIVLEELLHYSLLHEFLTQRTVSPEEFAIFTSRTASFPQHWIISSIVNMIIPERYEQFLSCKKDNDFLDYIEKKPNLSLNQVRTLVNDLISF
ncbi:MAG: hypothetical protein JW791_05175 [Nanoarchaeota archaeon]|nr:hypothetical protein [Nanoarchaeota archaeon]